MEKLIKNVIFEKLGLKVKSEDAKAISEELMVEFINEIKSEHGLVLKGIGKIQSKETPARMVRNPVTKQMMKKDACQRACFKPSTNLKKVINE